MTGGRHMTRVHRQQSLTAVIASSALRSKCCVSRKLTARGASCSLSSSSPKMALVLNGLPRSKETLSRFEEGCFRLLLVLLASGRPPVDARRLWVAMPPAHVADNEDDCTRRPVRCPEFPCLTGLSVRTELRDMVASRQHRTVRLVQE